METSAQVGRGERRRKGSLTILPVISPARERPTGCWRLPAAPCGLERMFAVGLLSCSQWPQTQIFGGWL